MRSKGISLPVFVCLFLSISLKAQENGSVGIGIENPNPNAILHLVSPGNNQGLLIPSMTTAQRTSSSFTNELSAGDNGLLVFDISEKAFYYWKDTDWKAFSSNNQTLQFDQVSKKLTLQGGNAIDLSSLSVTDWNELENTPADFLDGTDEVDDADADPLNEIQDLSISGTLLSITNNENATIIDLSEFTGSASQDLIFQDGVITLSGDPDATAINLSGYDSDTSDDFDGRFESLTGVPVDLEDGDQVDDADADPMNEIQSLRLVDDVLTLTGDQSGTLLNFSGWDQNASDDFNGQFGSLTGVPTGLADGDQVDDADADPLNEIQTISTNNVPGNITLSNDKTLNLNVNDADANSSNELISTTSLRPGNILRINEAGINHDVNLSELVNDADASASNELITSASLQPGNILRINEASTNHDVDLSSIASDADADPNNELQTLSYNYSNFLLTLSDQSTVIDLSSLNNASPWDDNGINVSFDGLYANANNFTSTPKTERLVTNDFITNRIDQVDIEDSKFVPVFISSGTSMLSFIEPGRQGQELVLMVIGGGSLQVNGTGGNLHLSADLHTLTTGSTIHLVYFQDLINGTGFDGWMELSKSASTR